MITTYDPVIVRGSPPRAFTVRGLTRRLENQRYRGQVTLYAGYRIVAGLVLLLLVGTFVLASELAGPAPRPQGVCGNCQPGLGDP